MRETPACLHFRFGCESRKPVGAACRGARRMQGDSTVGRVRRPSSLMREGDIIFIRIPVFLDLRSAQTAQSWESHVGILFRERTGAWTVSIARFRL